MIDTTPEEAWDMGHEAGSCMAPEDANPFDLDTQPELFMAWNDGHAFANADEERDA